MKRISNREFKKIEGALLRLDDIRDECEHHIGEALDVIHDQKNKYNKLQAEVSDMLEKIQTKQQEYYKGRSIDWQDTDRGEVYSEWMDEWLGINISPLEVFIEGPEVDDNPVNLNHVRQDPFNGTDLGDNRKWGQ